MEGNTLRGITDLPVELIQHVCSFLMPTGQHLHEPLWRCQECIHRRPGCGEWNLGQVAVSRLSRTCKRLHDVLQPLIFLCFADRGGNIYRRLVRLARTLTERPDLARHMRFLMLHEPGNSESSEKQFVEDAATQLLQQQFGGGGGGARPALPYGWRPDGDPEFRLHALELVLARTWNLEYLRIPLDYDWSLPLLDLLLPDGRFSLPNLKQLDVLHYYISGDRFDISMDVVETILHAAPNLRGLSLPSPNGQGGDSLPVANLRWLDLRGDCSIDPELLTLFMSSAPKLEKLALDWDALSDAYEYCDDRRVADAWHAIELRKDSLRQLLLYVREDVELGEVRRDNLRDFEKLEVLKVDEHSLNVLRVAWYRNNMHATVDEFLARLFPPSIRQITIWDPDGIEMRDAMLRFASVVALGMYPNLERVALAANDAWGREQGNEWNNADAWDYVKDKLEEDFGKGGVTFEVRRTSTGWYPSTLGLE